MPTCTLTVEEIYAKYYGRVYSFCMKRCHNSVDAEDFAQQTFLKVFLHLKEFRGTAKLTTWLYRIAFNEANQELRKSWYKRRVSLLTERDEADNDDRREETVMEPTFHSPADYVETNIILANALRQVPLCARRAVILHDLLGYTHAEVSELVGTSIGASKSNLFKGRKRLKELIKGKGK